MPEKSKINPDDEDDLQARFAHLQSLENEPADDELPPVPRVTIARPERVPLPGEPNYGAKGGKGAPNRVLGGGMFAGGDMRSSGAALTIGTGLVGSIIVGTGLGWLLDKYVLHSVGTPWGLIAGFLLGVVSGFVQLIRVTNQLNKD